MIGPHLYGPSPIVPVLARFFMPVLGGTGAVPASAKMSMIGTNGATEVDGDLARRVVGRDPRDRLRLALGVGVRADDEAADERGRLRRDLDVPLEGVGDVAGLDRLAVRILQAGSEREGVGLAFRWRPSGRACASAGMILVRRAPLHAAHERQQRRVDDRVELVALGREVKTLIGRLAAPCPTTIVMVPPFLPELLAEPLELLELLELPHAASANAAPAATTAIKADLDNFLIKRSSSSEVDFPGGAQSFGWSRGRKSIHKSVLGEPVRAVPNGRATRRFGVELWRAS